jgi:hypothetical protein
MVRSTEWFYTGLPAVGVEEAQRWHTTGDPSVLDFLMNTPDYIEMFWYMTAVEDVPNDIPLKMFLPPLHISPLDSERFADLQVPITTFVKQALTEFVIGTRNINSNTDWNAYLAELDRLGSKDMLSIMQKYVR